MLIWSSVRNCGKVCPAICHVVYCQFSNMSNLGCLSDMQLRLLDPTSPASIETNSRHASLDLPFLCLFISCFRNVLTKRHLHAVLLLLSSLPTFWSQLPYYYYHSSIAMHWALHFIYCYDYYRICGKNMAHMESFCCYIAASVLPRESACLARPPL